MKISKNTKFPLLFGLFFNKTVSFWGASPPPPEPPTMHTSKFFTNFREKFEKFVRKFCKNRNIFIKIMKNWPKIGSAPGTPHAATPDKPLALSTKSPTPGPCHRMV